MVTRKCKQCGEIRPIERFRLYYNGRSGHYTTCKLCEKINSRYKYLSKKSLDQTMTDEDVEEFSAINALYAKQRSLGLTPPSHGSKRQSLLTDIKELSAHYDEMIPDEGFDGDMPMELAQWLSCELTKDPDYYQDEVYEELKDKYRPQLRIDAVTLTPVYDDTYKTVLEHILDRFNEYEDQYYKE